MTARTAPTTRQRQRRVARAAALLAANGREAAEEYTEQFIDGQYSQHVITVETRHHAWHPRYMTPIEVKVISFGDNARLPAERIHIEIRETDHANAAEYARQAPADFVIYADNLVQLVAALTTALERARADGLVPPPAQEPADWRTARARRNRLANASR